MIRLLAFAALLQLPLQGELSIPGITFRYAQEQEGLARQLARTAAAAPPLPGLPPARADTAAPIQVYLAPSPQHFESLTGRRAPDWSAGVAYPDAGVIVLPAFASERAPIEALARTLRHEIAHVRLHRFVAPADVPRWFDEGYARHAAGEWDAESAWQIRLAFALQRAPSLDSLALTWPAGEARARLAYLLSSSAVQYLVEASGERGLERFLARWRTLGALEPALREVYGVSLSQLEEDWRDWVGRRYGWAAFFAQAVVFWFFVTILLFVLRWRRRRRDRVRLEAMRATEPPDRPAYWLGEETEAEVGPQQDASGPESGQPTGPDSGTGPASAADREGAESSDGSRPSWSVRWHRP